MNRACPDAATARWELCGLFSYFVGPLDGGLDGGLAWMVA
jgi:hypothetical protein